MICILIWKSPFYSFLHSYFLKSTGNLLKGSLGVFAYGDIKYILYLPFVEKEYLVYKKRENTVIQGFSMGGFGAVKFAFKYPGNLVN